MRKFRLDKDKELTIVNWVKKALDIRALWDKEDAYGSTDSRRPVFPYVLLNILVGPNKIGDVDQSYNSEDTFNYRRHKTVTVSVNLYARDNHLELLENLADSLDYEDILADFKTNDLYFIRHTDVLDISALLETGNEFRATMDVMFGYSYRTTRKIGEITSIEIDYAVKSNKGNHYGQIKKQA